MKIVQNRIFAFKSVFAKLVAGFTLVILIVSSFNLVLYRYYTQNIEAEMLGNATQRLDNISGKFDNYFERLRGVFLNIYDQDELNGVLNKRELSAYDMRETANILGKYTTRLEGISTLFIYSQGTDYIMSSSGSDSSESFFGKIYGSSSFNKDFWLLEMKDSFNFKIYWVDGFTDRANFNAATTRQLLPVAFKLTNRSDFIIVALIDIGMLGQFFDKNFTENFYIINHEEKMLYISEAEKDMINAAKDYSGNPVKLEEGFAISKDSDIGQFRYVKFISSVFLKNQLVRNNTIFAAVLLVSFIVSLFVSVFISGRFYSVVRRIVEVLKKSQEVDENSKNITELLFIRNNVEKIIERNMDYTREIKEKNSLLKTFLLQTKMKDIYLHINEFKEGAVIEGSYYIVSFTVHYKKAYYRQIGDELNKGAFFIKELIDLYIKEFFKDAVTFQSESNRIVSVIQTEDENGTVFSCIGQILEKLKPEEEYVIFTAALSGLNRDITHMDKVYNKVLELSRYRKVSDSSQILQEEGVGQKCGKFHFSVKQAECMTNLIQEGKGEESVREMFEVLEFNYKNGINTFYMKLLCIEIINCCIKALYHLYNNLPDSFNVSDIHARLGECYCIEQYKDICTEAVLGSVDYIESNKVKKDHITDFIKEYIEENYSQDIYLDLLAEKLGMTREYVSWYYKNRSGCNISDYIRIYRIEKAMELLESSNMQVKDIAEKVGFGNVNTFIRSFKQTTGKTPKEYRQSKVSEI